MQVQGVIRETPGVTKISFVAHSLGGLIARYAIGQLYSPPHEPNVLDRQRNDASTGEDPAVSVLQPRESGQAENSAEAASISYDTMAGLEPANFITVATPHLGSRGSQQVW